MTASRMPRLALCITAFEYGGQGRVVEEEAKGLRDRFRITLCTDRCTRSVPDGIDVEVADRRRRATHDVRQTTRMLKAFDVVHCHDSVSYMYAARDTGRPWVVTSHGICPSRYRNSVKSAAAGLASRVVYPLLYRSATSVVAISTYIQRWLWRAARVEAVLIPNGAPTVLDGAVPSPRGRPLLYVGELSRRKGVHELLRALQCVPPDVVLTMVGSGDVAGLTSAIRNQGLDKRVTIRTSIGDEELDLLYDQAFATCSASHWEGFGLPVMEGFSRGRPAVVRDVGGLSELVSLSHAGATFRSLGDFPAAVEHVSSEWEAFSSAGISYARDHAWPAVFLRYGDLFDSLVGRRR